MIDHEEQLAGRLNAMYQRMKEAQVDLYLVPSSDAHLNEYVPEYSRRRAAVTGFTAVSYTHLTLPTTPYV